MSFRARQQFFFQPSPARPELLDVRLETIEELDDLAVLVTKRVEAYVSSPLIGAPSLRPPGTSPAMFRMRSTTSFLHLQGEQNA